MPPEGPLARLIDRAVVRLCGRNPWLDVLGVDLAARPAAPRPLPPAGVRRKLFALMRHHCDDFEAGGSAVFAEMDAEQ